jgi:type I restriction enzyme S subunit
MTNATAQLLEQYFDTAFSAPNGIKKLRELILTLAMQGKLVAQDLNDQPVSQLLKDIAVEKERLVKEGKLKKQKPLPAIDEDEKPYPLPQGWEWVRLGEIATKLTDGSHNPPRDSGSGYPMLSSQNVTFGRIDFSNPSRYVSESDFVQENKRTSIQVGDILLTIVASLGRPAVVPSDAPKFVLQRSVAVIRLPILSEFSCLLLGSSICTDYYDLHAKGTAQKGIYLGKLGEMPIPLPPLAEQRRIVAKIDELMAKCDALEALQQAQATQRTQTHQAAIQQLLTTDDTSTAWQFLKTHFETLYQDKANVKELRKAILQLAVMGKLVPQDPNDQPASELLKDIAAEKERLEKEGKIKKQKPLPTIGDDEKPYPLPQGWEWVRMDDLCNEVTAGSTPPQSIFNEFEGVPFLKVYNIRNQLIDFSYKKQFIDPSYHKEKMKRSTLFPGDVVMNIVGPPLGKIAIIPSDYPEYNCNQAIVLFRLNKIKMNRYVYVYLLAGTFLERIELIGTAGQDNISVTKSKTMLVPLPPLAEQQRIVAKIDQLMSLCDQLEARIDERTGKQSELLAAVMSEV